MGDVPKNEREWENLARAKKYKCENCKTLIPFGEREIYFKRKLCGYCAHVADKSKEE